MSDPNKSFSYSGSPWGSTTPPNLGAPVPGSPWGSTTPPNLGVPVPGSPWGSTTPPNLGAPVPFSPWVSSTPQNPNGQPNFSAPGTGSPWGSTTPPNPNGLPNFSAPVPINIPIPSNPTHVLEGPGSSSFSHGSHSVIHSSIGGYPVPSHGSYPVPSHGYASSSTATPSFDPNTSLVSTYQVTNDLSKAKKPGKAKKPKNEAQLQQMPNNSSSLEQQSPA